MKVKLVTDKRGKQVGMSTIYKTLLLIVLLCAGQQAMAQNFITQWDLSIAGVSGPSELYIGTATSGTVNYTWQEISPGSASGSGSWSGSSLYITGLPTGATIRLEIAPANLQRVMMVIGGYDGERLINIENWGSVGWTSMEQAFRLCTNLQITATDVPDLSGVASMARMFGDCTNLNSPGNINTWNTTAVTDMQYLFHNASAFNQDIGSWNTVAVTNMTWMFSQANAFNQNIGSWNTSSVTNMEFMFFGAAAFNNGGNSSINNWNTGAVTRMTSMFSQASAFNQNIGSWNTAAVTTMNSMFNSASSFNQDIGGWNTAAVTNMGGMFYQASAFNQNIGSWNTNAATTIGGMFMYASAFNNGGSNSINNWNTAGVTNLQYMFYLASAFNQNIGSWNTSAVTDMQFMFTGASAFNQNIGSWNTAAVTNMRFMFQLASAFNNGGNGSINNWNTAAVTSMAYMFDRASAFNQNIGSWNTAAVSDMGSMFWQATAFNQNIGMWTLKPAVSMISMLNFSGIDCVNYSSTLIGWSNNPSTPNNILMEASGRQYGTNAVAARTNLTTTKGWTISFDSASGTICISVPTITNFTPTSGPIGTTVTITGTKFSSTPANNVVYFGATRATVTTATSTQLTVTVPIGATYQPITVQVAGLTAYSSKPFVVTFTGGGSIDACSFAPKTDIATSISPFGITMGDFDGDGKVDLAVANRTSATISVYRNISTTGSITASSFASPINLPTGTGDPFSIKNADLDGDGKLDLIITRVLTVNLLSIYRNTSTLGNLSFDSSVDFATGVDALFEAIGDLDGDGKPEIVVGNRFSNTISVFKNTSTPGAFTTSSFATKVDFTTGSEPHSIAIADLDNDSKPDIVNVNNLSNTVSVLRNTSTSGVIDATSFSAKVDFNTGSRPYGVALSDIDNDDKIDIVITNNGDNSVSILKNIGTGAITTGSFATKVDFATGSEPVLISITDLDGDTRPDIITPNYSSNTVSLLKNVSSSGTINSTSLSASVNFASASNPLGSVIGDLDSDGKPEFVVTNQSSNSLSIFRNLIGEISPPTITSFSPSSGPIGTSVTITGTNFSTTPTNNLVKFNGVAATVTASTATSITTVVPAGATAGIIEVTIGCNTVTSVSNFTVGAITPIITSFSPSSGPVGTTVTITGTNFSTTPANNIVYFGAVWANVTAATSTQLTVTVPTGATYQPITVQVAGLTAYSSKPFVVTFAGGGTINNCTLAPVFSVPNTNIFFGLSGADYDQDGKIDMVVANISPAKIKVYRNSSTPGLIDASSFANPVELTVPSGEGYNINSADLDGDGKIDIIVSIPTTDAVALYRNTSSSGNISFDNPVDFAAGFDPLYTSVTDLDADGKPEIVAVNRFSNSISVFKNTTVAGGFTSSSFAPKVDFSVGSEPYTVKIADLNADNKPDIVVSNSVSNTLSIFENTSLQGSINSSSFASPITLPTGVLPHTSILTDFDGDGKIDIAVANVFSNTVSVFRNIYSSGPMTALSFGSVLNFAANAGSVDLAADDMDGDGKVDIVVSNQSTDKISILKNTSSPGSISFQPHVDFVNGPYPAILFLADIDGDGKPDVLNMSVNSNTVGIFRNIADTPAPTITSFTPSSGSIGTSVTLTGTNFNTPFTNTVKINGIAATITSSTSTSLTVTIPASTTTGPFDVTIGCNTVTSASSFCFPSSAPTSLINGNSCGTGTVTVSVSGGVNGQYRWYTSSTGGTPITGEVNDIYTTPTISATTSYYVSINDGTCESLRTSVVALVIAPPAAPTVTGASNFPPAVLTLTASGGTNGQYRWYTTPTGGTALVGEVNGTYTTPPLSISTTYYVSINDGQCESSRTPVVAGINVNSAPVILPTTAEVPVEGTVTISLTALISDPEDNLDFSTLSIVSQPISGARASIEPVNNLVLDYSAISFSGLDQLTIGICDQLAVCSQKELTIDVVGDITVYNAISTNGDDKNPVFFLKNIDILADTKENKVTIFNRWGDIVFEAENYDNVNQVFRGLNKSGDELPSGTYYYRIEFVGGKETKTGFLALKK